MSPLSPPRVAVVDDHSLFAESLVIALALEGYDARKIILDGDAKPPVRLLSAILKLRPRTALVDLDLGTHGDGLQLVRPLARAGIATVVVTASTARGQWGACIANGARKVVPKLAPLTDIVGTIRRIHDGLPVMTGDERDDLLQAWRDTVAESRETRARLDLLTRGEAEVLGMMMSGLQVSDIARERFVSESTIRTQVKSILAKLQVSSQLTAVGKANRVGWRPPRDERLTRSPIPSPRLVEARRPLASQDHQR